MLPYALDPRHAPDTLFLVAECDFRFYRKDCEEDERAFGKDMEAQMVRAVQRAFDRGCAAAYWRREELQRGPEGEATGSSGARGSAELPAAPVGGAASPGTGGSPARRPSPSPAPGPEESPQGGDPGLVSVALPAEASGRAEATDTVGASLPSPSPAAPGAGSPSPSPSPALQEEVRRAFMRSLAREERDMTFFGWQRGCPPCPPSQELTDLVRVCTQAERLGRGNLVWLAWEANNSKKTMPSHGSTLMALTPAFARSFLSHLQEVEPDHLDLVLLRWLRKGRAFVRERVSFLYPACGSYVAHESGCESKLGVRPSSWDKSWIGEGCRCTNRGKRYLASWAEKGHAEWLCPLNLDDDSLVWRTERPPSTWEDPRWEWRLWNRGWVDDMSQWVGPSPVGASERRRRGRGKGRGAVPSPSPAAPNPSPAPHSWTAGDGASQRTQDQLRDDPDGYRQLRGQWYAPITRLAEELVTDPHWLDHSGAVGAHTRMGRQRRKNISAYLRRRFAETEQAPTFLFR